MIESPQRKGPGRPKQSAGSRDEIFRVAVKLFAMKGYDAVTVREIASAASVSLPTLYHYFQDKMSLYRAVVIERQLELEVVLEADLSSVQTPAEFRIWLETLIKSGFQQSDLNRLLYREMLSPRDDLHRDMASRSLQPLYDSLRSKMNAIWPGKGDGVLPLLILSTMFGMVTLDPFRRYLVGYAPALVGNDQAEAERRAYVDQLMQLFEGPTSAAPGTEEADLLRAAVVQLTLEKVKMQQAAIPSENPS